MTYLKDRIDEYDDRASWTFSVPFQCLEVQMMGWMSCGANDGKGVVHDRDLGLYIEVHGKPGP